MFHMGDKYTIEDYKATALKNIIKAFPEDLETWDKVQKGTHSCMHINPEEYISVANFACDRPLDIPSHIRWQALYQCCQLPDASLVKGVTMPDGTKEVLSAENLKRCIRARRTLMWKDLEQTMDVAFPTPSETPECTPTCKAGQSVVRLTVGKRLPWKRFSYNCLSDFRPEIAPASSDSGVCRSCIKSRETAFEDSRANLLANLSDYFEGVF